MTKLSIISGTPTCGIHTRQSISSVQFATICSMTMWWSRSRSGNSLSRTRWNAAQMTRPAPRNTAGMAQGSTPARQKQTSNAVSTT